MTWQHQLLFPTRVITAQSDDAELLAGLRDLFAWDDRFRRPDYNDVADQENLLALSDQHPALRKLKEFMWHGLQSWLRAESVTGEYSVHTLFFPNYSRKGGFVPAHNHISHVSGVFYVSVPEYNGDDIITQGTTQQYWSPDHGALLLHDPRFNSSLVELTSRTYAKVLPRPGLGIIFPSYLWHSVTPHYEDQDRIAIAANFTLEPKGAVKEPADALCL